ncbi:MAG: HAMP domain-containing protein, partial [Dehalococcoidales bacterium]|nr:HAMP domain-containing protein [Dehalococcoidales bacterium]
MRSLSWKLGVALLLMVVVSVGLMAYLTNRSTTREFQQYVSQGNLMYARMVADNLGEFYAGEQGWGDIQEVMATSLRSAGERILVADRSGVIMADTDRQWLGRQIQETGLSGGVVITASGEAVGELYLLVSGRQGMGMGHMGGAGAHMMPMMLGAEEDFLDRVNDSLWQAGLIAAGVALLVGLVLTRQITRPVRNLISGVRHIAGGELGYRVPVRSRDEIGELSD